MAEHLPLSVRVPIEADNPSICRKEELCIKCGQCREVCTNEAFFFGMLLLLFQPRLTDAIIVIS